VNLSVDNNVLEEHTISSYSTEDVGNMFLQNVTTQKMNIDIFTAVRPSNFMLDVRVWIDSRGSEQVPVAGFCKHGNEPWIM
jgi:hypothetical protein